MPVLLQFSSVFATTGISILYKKPQKKPPNLFSFLSPLSVEVWIYMCTAYLAVSLAMYAMSRYHLNYSICFARVIPV